MTLVTSENPGNSIYLYHVSGPGCAEPGPTPSGLPRDSQRSPAAKLAL
jgi:hypothetical protein